MKRYISEGNCLENASWRLWHMQRLNRLAARTDAVDDPHNDILRASRKSVYCNFTSTTLSCNRCCHEVYCVRCFKLIHMRGRFAPLENNNVCPRSNGAAILRPSRHRPVVVQNVWEHNMDALFQKLMATNKGPMSEHETANFLSHLIQRIDFCLNNGVS
ncbi:hypothetical protein DYB31_002161, partial [Aphanomyces astaci]